MSNEVKGTIAMLNLKIAKDDKDAFFAKCNERGVKPSMVTRKLIELWMNDTIKLEI